MREKVSKIAHEYAVINLFLFIYAAVSYTHLTLPTNSRV